MPSEIGALSVAALSLGFLHTLCGPDHYLPFVAMSRIGGWSLARTIMITVLCGIGHVGSSVVLGTAGIAFGIVVLNLDTIETIEAQRGDLAGWMLLAFGLAYFCWGLVRAIRNQPHTHLVFEPDGSLGAAEHVHNGLLPLSATALPTSEGGPATAASAAGAGGAGLTPWVLFTIFLFGPCEPLIPMLMYPAARASAWGVALVTALFGLATLITMSAMVALLYAGVGVIRWPHAHRFGHAIAGLVVLACGLAVTMGL